MTAAQYFHFTLTCNHIDGCRSRFSGNGQEARASVRKRAKRAGWRTVRSPAGRKYDDDYCPSHPPQQ